MSKEFDFRNANTKKSYKMLSEEDQERFPFAQQIEFQAYFTTCLRGARKYLLHQDDKTIPKSIIKLRILQTIHYSIILGFFIYMTLKLFRVLVPQ